MECPTHHYELKKNKLGYYCPIYMCDYFVKKKTRKDATKRIKEE